MLDVVFRVLDEFIDKKILFQAKENMKYDEL